MSISGARRKIRTILEDGPQHLDLLSRLSLAFEYLAGEVQTLHWIGLYLLSLERKEMLLGPFFGHPRGPVRFPYEGMSMEEGILEGEILGQEWYLRRIGATTVRLTATQRARLQQDRILLMNLKTRGRWNAQLEAKLSIFKKPMDQAELEEDYRIIAAILPDLGILLQDRLPIMDLDDPFSGDA